MWLPVAERGSERWTHVIMRRVSSPTPDPVAGVRRAYDAVAEDYAAYLPDTRAESPVDLAMVDVFADAVGTEGGSRILDAGCGTGRMSRYLSGRGCLVEGVDLSPGMVEMARRDGGDLTFTVGSLADLPYAEDEFAGVLLWYSIIHTPPSALARVFAEASRVLRPGGHLLVGFQSGEGVRDVSAAYRRFGHEIELERHLHTADQVAAEVGAVGLHEVARLVRRAQGRERDDQAVLHARGTG